MPRHVSMFFGLWNRSEMLRCGVRCWCCAAALLLCLSPTSTRSVAHADGPAQSTASIEGHVTARDGRPLPRMVVYLEPVNVVATSTAPAPPHVVVSQRGAQFSPSLIVVCVGQTVDFGNDEPRLIEHNVFSRSPAKPFDLGLYGPGVTRSVTFDKPGAVRLFCSIHRYMDGVVYVCPSPYFATVAADGRFTIGGVPSGDYRAKTWQLNARFAEQSRDVHFDTGAATVTTLDFEMGRR